MDSSLRCWFLHVYSKPEMRESNTGQVFPAPALGRCHAESGGACFTKMVLPTEHDWVSLSCCACQLPSGAPLRTSPRGPAQPTCDSGGQGGDTREGRGRVSGRLCPLCPKSPNRVGSWGSQGPILTNQAPVHRSLEPPPPCIPPSPRSCLPFSGVECQ